MHAVRDANADDSPGVVAGHGSVHTAEPVPILGRTGLCSADAVGDGARKCLCGSALTGSPSHPWGSKASPIRA